MLIEAKAYKDGRAKRDLLSGISQLHAYLSSLDALRNFTEAYYVVFRLGGPIYEFPQVIQTSRYMIYPILIDLGLSNESGHSQKNPISISEEEILGRLGTEE
jgi:hypothetical protein